MKEQRKEQRKEGMKEQRNEGTKEGRNEGMKEGMKEQRKDIDLRERQFDVQLPRQRGQLFKSSANCQIVVRRSFCLDHMMGSIEANGSRWTGTIADQLWCMDHVLSLVHSEVATESGV
jgi:hypothetical protein